MTLEDVADRLEAVGGELLEEAAAEIRRVEQGSGLRAGLLRADRRALRGDAARAGRIEDQPDRIGAGASFHGGGLVTELHPSHDCQRSHSGTARLRH